MTVTPRLQCGRLKISDDGIANVAGNTLSKVNCTGLAHRYSITGPARLRLTIADITWSNGERDIRTVDRHQSPKRFDRLVHGLRLGVHTVDGSHKRELLRVELRQAQMTSATWAQARMANLTELDTGADCDVAAVLRSHGADHIGTRGDLLGDESSHRNKLCALFPSQREVVPIIAYMITRIAPLFNQIRCRS